MKVTLLVMLIGLSQLVLAMSHHHHSSSSESRECSCGQRHEGQRHPKDPHGGQRGDGRRPKGSQSGGRDGHHGDGRPHKARPEGKDTDGGRPAKARPEGGQNGGTRPKCADAQANLVPLYRSLHGGTLHHFITANYNEFLNAVLKGGYTSAYGGTYASVATNPKDCHGKETLKPLYRFVAAGAPMGQRYVYTMTPADYQKAGFTADGIAFYCASAKDDSCGATINFVDTWRDDNAAHYYTRDPVGEGATPNGWVHSRLLCYIWSYQGDVKQ